MRLEGSGSSLELTDNARVAVMGGGPAGSMTAYFMLEMAKQVGIRLQIDIYEPRSFHLTGPRGCNFCGGIISESLVEMLAAEGLQLPQEVIIDTINTYTLHTKVGSVPIQSPKDEMRIAGIFRGGGPKGAESQRPLPWDSFDWFLLQRACAQGARHVPHRITDLSWSAGRPVVTSRGGGGGTYDFLVAATGLNGGSMEVLGHLNFGYKPPKTTKAYVAELYYGNEQVEKLLGDSMHVFLLDIPGLKFVALTPKRHYATLIILGDDINRDMIVRVFKSPQVQALFPLGWDIPVHPCQCYPHINIGMSSGKLFTDRVVVVGDCGVSRLYKDGIGAAYRTAKACAVTAVTHGVSAADFRQYYHPVCRKMSLDNDVGHILFAIDGVSSRFDFLREGMLDTVRREQRYPHRRHSLSAALWDTFTGSASYADIFMRTFNPLIMSHYLWASFKALGRRIGRRLMLRPEEKER
ncbi:MAG: hypothetical protein HQL53_05425 [Magnetococcales bacterium]|nr:hypothetical protein [Magnetococcales bacterium]